MLVTLMSVIPNSSTVIFSSFHDEVFVLPSIFCQDPCKSGWHQTAIRRVESPEYFFFIIMMCLFVSKNLI